MKRKELVQWTLAVALVLASAIIWFYGPSPRTAVAAEFVASSAAQTESCGGQSYDPATQGCCQGTIYDLATQGCCIGGIYDLATQVCCRGWVVSID